MIPGKTEQDHGDKFVFRETLTDENLKKKEF